MTIKFIEVKYTYMIKNRLFSEKLFVHSSILEFKDICILVFKLAGRSDFQIISQRYFLQSEFYHNVVKCRMRIEKKDIFKHLFKTINLKILL